MCECVRDKRSFVGADIGESDVLDIIDRGSESDYAADVWGARLEARRNVFVESFFRANIEDHPAAKYDGCQ